MVNNCCKAAGLKASVFYDEYDAYLGKYYSAEKEKGITTMPHFRSMVVAIAKAIR